MIRASRLKSYERTALHPKVEYISRFAIKMIGFTMSETTSKHANRKIAVLPCDLYLSAILMKKSDAIPERTLT
jgi:hypothetical protein